MAKYVDFSSAGSGHAGTEIDPFSFSDFITDIGALVATEDYYCKGTYETDGAVNFTGSQIYNTFGWDISTNGPWRL